MRKKNETKIYQNLQSENFPNNKFFPTNIVSEEASDVNQNYEGGIGYELKIDENLPIV